MEVVLNSFISEGSK